MTVEVVPADPEWGRQFERVADDLGGALRSLPVHAIEHVGSTSVPGLAAKPILDIDVLVMSEDIPAAINALEAAGYTHQGDLGVPGREAFLAPDDSPRRHVYLSTPDNLHIKNHLAVRDVLRSRTDLRDEYAAVKLALATEPHIDSDTYGARKSEVLQKVLAESSLSEHELRAVLLLNDPRAGR
ncbi:GrpB family protein [Ornithinimicrobium faecis]|uniref:GrpB family protein n=1 Tax=Ornithinimicrobium faecis TaxID=2934158 RepID=UPI002117B53F|nr:GrpB family protein [Ornithinimicrobium sp. HY1745]